MAKLFSPLGGDTVSPLNAPPVHMGLLTKLNLLAIGLIVATALGVAAFLIGQQIRDEESRLRTQGLAMAAMLAEVADEAISSSDMSNVASVLDGLVSDRDIAYVAVLDAQQRPLITRSYGDATVPTTPLRSEEHTSELQSQSNLVCRLLLEKHKSERLDPIFHKMIVHEGDDRFNRQFRPPVHNTPTPFAGSYSPTAAHPSRASSPLSDPRHR